MKTLLLAPAIAALLSFLLTPLTRRLAVGLGAVDLPGPRKIHRFPIPRLGGLAVIGSAATVLALLGFIGASPGQMLDRSLALGMGLGLVPILLVSIRDDIRPLGAIPKFAAHFAGAGIALAFGIRLAPTVHLFGGDVPLGFLALPISILWIVGVTNAFNIVDGLDGLSAGLALISALSLAGMSFLTTRTSAATAALVLAAAIVGFLPFNVYPARIFLGDSGATAIGFALACLALRGGSTLSAGMAVAVPILLIGVPIADTLVSMARRLMRRLEPHAEKSGMFKADRDHIHHRLLDMGITQRRAVWMLYAVGLILASSGFASLFLAAKTAALLLVTLLAAAWIGIMRLNYDEFALVRRGIMLRVYEAPVLRRALFPVFFDLALVVASIYGAIVLKYDDWSLARHRDLAFGLLRIFPAVTVFIFWAFQLYRGAWRRASAEEFLRSVGAVIVSTFVGTGLITLTSHFSWPTTFYAAYGLILLALVGGSRASYRLLDDMSRRASSSGERVLIYGAGSGGALALREMLANRDWLMRPVGYVDDDSKLVGRIVAGFPVLGSWAELDRIVKEKHIEGIVVTSDKISQERLAEVEGVSRRTGAWVSRFLIRFEPL